MWFVRVYLNTVALNSIFVDISIKEHLKNNFRWIKRIIT